MLQVVYCYGFGLLGFVNSVNTPSLALQIVNVLAGGFFLVIGSIAGWQHARRDD